MPEFQNLVQMQESRCRENRERPMYGTKQGDRHQWTTFGQFADMVNDLRAGLAGLGVGAGDKVAIIANNCLEWPVCAYATYGLGAHFVPMYESQPLSDWEYIINDSGAKILLVRTPELLQKIKHLPGEIDCLQGVVLLQGQGEDCPTFQDLRHQGQTWPVPSRKPGWDEPFGLIYTSGTTGDPKGVILTHGNLMTELESAVDILDFRSDDVSLAFLPWGHLMGQIEEVHFLIFKGFSAAIVENIDELMQDFQAVRPTIFFTVPKVYQRFYQAVNDKIKAKGALTAYLFDRGSALGVMQRRGDRLGPGQRVVMSAADRLVFKKIREIFGGRLRMSLCGGAALNPEVVGFLELLGVYVHEGYGLTETTMAVAINTTEARRHGSVGQALQGVRIELDQDVEGAGRDEGEVIVYGGHVAAGYHNKQELFAQCLTPGGGFRTGDLGRFDNDGFLYITGRVKELYKLANGKYVAPAPLEERLRQSPFINHAMIYGDNQDYNVLLVVPEPSAFAAGADPVERERLLERDINNYSVRFKSFERPRRFAVVDDDWTVENGMLTPTLKIKRLVVTKKYQPVLDGLYAA